MRRMWRLCRVLDDVVVVLVAPDCVNSVLESEQYDTREARRIRLTTDSLQLVKAIDLLPFS